LSALPQTKARLLTAGETAAFLLRHPTIAARVAITRAGIAAGVYDINYYDLEAEWPVVLIRFPGVIYPRGLQVMDSVYQLVTSQPTLNGIYFSGWSPRMGDAEKDPFVSPSGNDPFADLIRLLKTLAGGVVLVYLAGKVLEGRRR